MAVAHSIRLHGQARIQKLFFFFITSGEVTANVALSMDGIRVVQDSDSSSARFSNPSKQFMEQATVPKEVADTLCSELNIKYENCDLSDSF
ncbi:hypothetical protein AAFX24_28265 [Vibrio mediterranei]|uniref:hypothetical protein n=1 Tax=Vibrio mediterranei TaxID=689 RepID=UPI0038CE84BE